MTSKMMQRTNAVLRQHTLIFVLILLTLLFGLTPGVAQSNTQAALSAVVNDGEIISSLHITGINDTAIVVIHMTDETGKLYIMPATQASGSIWRATIPIVPQRAILEAYANGDKVASLTKTFVETDLQDDLEVSLPQRQPQATEQITDPQVVEPIAKQVIVDEPTEKIMLEGAFGSTIEASIEVISNKGRDQIVRTTSEARSEQGEETHTVIVVPQETPIEKITFNEVDINTVRNGSLSISQPNVTEIPLNDSSVDTTRDIAQVFSIDPSRIGFTDAQMQVTAKGKELYKCAAWNFTTQVCEGRWVFHQRITPGTEYNVTLTPKDPAFAEVTVLAMEWAVLRDVNETWRTVNLNYSYVSPVIIATPHYNEVGVPTVTRINNITANSFEVRLQTAGSGTATTRNVSYLVVEEGNWTLPDGSPLEAVTYTSTTTDENGDWSPDSRNYQHSFTRPVVFGQVMSYNDPDWSVFWSSDGSRLNPATPTALATAKHVAEDPDITRANEVIGYVVMDEGHANFSGNEYDVHLSPDIVQGVGNSPPYTSSFNASFENTPKIIIVSMAAMDGVNGGWGVAYGAPTTTQVNLAADEDIAADSERGHANEEMGVLAFEENGSFILNYVPIIFNETFEETVIEPTESILLNVTVTDENGNNTISGVNVTFRYPNGTLVNRSLTQIGTGALAQSGDLESGVETIVGEQRTAIGETRIVRNVNSWQTVSMNNTYVRPLVFAFSRNQSNIGSIEEEALAIVRNVTTSSFEVAVIAPNGSFITDDVGVLVMENGTHNVSGQTIQTGVWSYSGVSFVTRDFREVLSGVPTVYMQLQNNTDDWYTGRYDDATLSANRINIQFENANNFFTGVYELAYIAFEQGTTTSVFEGTVEPSVEDDPASGTWEPVPFSRNHSNPIFMGMVSDGGGDPTKLGINNLTEDGVNVRPTEDTFLDPEQAHATNDVLWIVFNGSEILYEETSQTDVNAQKDSDNYTDVESTEMQQISSITVRVNLTEYNTSGSVANGNANPSLELFVNTNNGWTSAGEKPISGTGITSWKIFESAILRDWKTLSNRDIFLRGLKIDFNSTNANDRISWNNVEVDLEGGNLTPIWRTEFTDTGEVGVYNVTNIYAYDYHTTVRKDHSNLSVSVLDQTPPTFTVIGNVTVNSNFPVMVTYKAVDYSGVANWTINDTTYFTINSTGFLTNATNLSERVYPLNVTVYDIYNNSRSQVVAINVTATPDTEPPVFSPPLTNITVDLDIGVNYDINATDNSGILDTFYLNDTSTFQIDDTTGVLTNSSPLSFRDYRIAVSVADPANNTNTSELLIIVIDTTPPVISVVNQTPEYHLPFEYTIPVTDTGGIGGYWLTGTTAFSVNSSGIIVNTTPLIKHQLYLMKVHVNDTSNNTNNQTFLVTPTDTTPPLSITGLGETTMGKRWILWNWTNPTNDFDHVEVYINGTFRTNTSNDYYNASGLSASTTYGISIRTADEENNVNLTWVNDTAKTSPNEDPAITVIAPLNVSLTSDPNETIVASIVDNDTTVLCTNIYGRKGVQATTDYLVSRNCSSLNNTNIDYDWIALPFEEIANTEILWHFDNREENGENATRVRTYTTGVAEDHNRTCAGSTCPSFREDEGVFAGAYHYDGVEDYWLLDESYFNDAFSVKTLELWFKADTTAGIGTLYEEGGSTNGWGVRINNGRIEHAARDSSTQVTISTPFTDTTSWHHLAIGFNNNNLTLYLDGVLVNTTTAGFTLISTHSNDGGLGATFGSDGFGTGSTGNYFTGLIDEVRITNAAPNVNDSITSLTDGDYYWYATVDDTFATISTGMRMFTVDTIGPYWTNATTSISSPATYSPSNNYAFNITWNDTNILEDVVIEHNFSGTPSNATPTSADNITFTLSVGPTSAGNYYWKSYANDSLGNQNSTSRMLYTINRADPGLTLLLNGVTNITVEDDELFNATVLLAAQLDPTDNFVNISKDSNVVANGSTTLTEFLRFNALGLHNVSASIDRTVNYTESTVIGVVNVTPEVGPDIIGNESTVQGNAQNVTVLVNRTLLNTTADYDGPLLINMSGNGTLLASFTHDFATPLNLSKIELYSYATNAVAFRDAEHQNVTLYVPLNGSVCNVKVCNGVVIEGSCDDNNTDYQFPSLSGSLCPVIVNGTFARDDPDGTDFRASASAIFFSDYTPYEGQNITVNATVQNIGETWATNVTVLIIQNSTGQVLRNYTIANFTAASNVKINTTFIAEAGPNQIDVKVDPENHYNESSEDNNNVSATLHVSAWQILYGTINKTLALGEPANRFHVWQDLSAVTGNVYAMDADSSISWRDLQSLGRTTTNTTATNDFINADEVLGISGFTDNITSRFSSNGSDAVTTANITVNGRLKAHVPIINSTNTSSFVTGILWDTSDDSNGEYDVTESEDLVFFTQVNASTAGAYGTYDYEITFPAALQDVNSTTGVTYLYAEIR